MNTISVDSNIYRGAELYLRKQPSLTLPAHLEKLGGCLAGIEDEKDEKLNYLLEKYK